MEKINFEHLKNLKINLEFVKIMLKLFDKEINDEIKTKKSIFKIENISSQEKKIDKSFENKDNKLNQSINELQNIVYKLKNKYPFIYRQWLNKLKSNNSNLNSESTSC